MDSRATENRRLGNQAEDAVLEILCARGCKLLARNFRAGNKGELDLVLEKNHRLIVVEVKSRREGDGYGGAASAVTARKIMRMKRATAVFMIERSITGIDVCLLAGCVTHDVEGHVTHIEFLPI